MERDTGAAIAKPEPSAEAVPLAETGAEPAASAVVAAQVAASAADVALLQSGMDPNAILSIMLQSQQREQQDRTQVSNAMQEMLG
eukprot:12526186-Alexandrium_andersonii.AAC.1